MLLSNIYRLGPKKISIESGKDLYSYHWLYRIRYHIELSERGSLRGTARWMSLEGKEFRTSKPRQFFIFHVMISENICLILAFSSLEMNMSCSSSGHKKMTHCTRCSKGVPPSSRNAISRVRGVSPNSS